MRQTERDYQCGNQSGQPGRTGHQGNQRLSPLARHPEAPADVRPRARALARHLRRTNLGMEIKRVRTRARKTNALARAWRAKADTGDAKALEMMKRLNERIEAMTRMRKHWANVARQTG